MIRLRSSILALVTILSAVSGFSQNRPSKKEAPIVAKNEAPKAMAQAAPDAVPALVDPKTYEIGAEDIIQVRIWRQPDFSGQYAVRPDGKITLPLVGDIKAAGMSPDALSSQIRQTLSDLIIDPQVTVQVMQVNSKKFYIAGEVNRPGQYPLVVATKVFDALSNAGGFRDFANKKNIVIIRGTSRIKFNYEEYISNAKKAAQNVYLENGDTIIVK